jgi:hypothetical protein
VFNNQGEEIAFQRLNSPMFWGVAFISVLKIKTGVALSGICNPPFQSEKRVFGLSRAFQ